MPFGVDSCRGMEREVVRYFFFLALCASCYVVSELIQKTSLFFSYVQLLGNGKEYFSPEYFCKNRTFSQGSFMTISCGKPHR